MLLKYFYDDQLAQASYMVGCAKTGEALVVDPMRDITPYLAAAQREGLRITHITETHIHADFVSGCRELAAATGATMYLSDEGDADWKYGYANAPDYAGIPNAILVRDGDTFMVGNIRVQVLHTPGHTLEHICFMVTDTAGANKPMGVFTGDFVCVGDIGRPDLLEEAAGVVGSKEPGARSMFASLQRFKQLPDYLQIWPGHGAGSACGKALGAIPSTTLGYEKLFSPAFQINDEQAFVDWLLSGQPEPPKYFARMKFVNKYGPALLKDLPALKVSTRADIDAALARGEQVFDLRDRAAFADAHIPRTISVPASNNLFSTYVGWFVKFDKPVHLIVSDPAKVAPLLASLRAIGVDDVQSVASGDVVKDGPHQTLPSVQADELAKQMREHDVQIIDIRGAGEYDELHIAGAKRIHLGYLPDRLPELAQDMPVVLQCASGYRSQIAASVLQNLGVTNVISLSDGKDVWAKYLPTSVGD